MDSEVMNLIAGWRALAVDADSDDASEALQLCAHELEAALTQPSAGAEAVATATWSDGRLIHVLDCSPAPDGVHQLYLHPAPQAATPPAAAPVVDAARLHLALVEFQKAGYSISADFVTLVRAALTAALTESPSTGTMAGGL